MDYTKAIELGIAEKLRKDSNYRKSFFRASATDSIALQIRNLRKARELKQAELAVAAEMKQSAISRIEQAEYSSWTFNTLSRIAEALEARLIIKFQPMEEAIRDFEILEYGISISKNPVYFSDAGTQHNYQSLPARGSTLNRNFSTPNPEKWSKTKLGSQDFVRVESGVTANG